jgi:hypothetical protein
MNGDSGEDLLPQATRRQPTIISSILVLGRISDSMLYNQIQFNPAHSGWNYELGILTTGNRHEVIECETEPGYPEFILARIIGVSPHFRSSTFHHYHLTIQLWPTTVIMTSLRKVPIQVLGPTLRLLTAMVLGRLVQAL